MRRTLLALTCCLALPAFAGNPAWTEPVAPHVIYGNTYFVGTKGLTSVLITSPQGHVLIDGTLPQNAGLIEANIRKLGFRVEDIKLILNTHAHVDHAGAIATIAKDTGARVAASELGAKELMLGGKYPEDPQYGETASYAPVPHVEVIADGRAAKAGTLSITAHYTPGHTPGSTTWTWTSCEGDRCLHMVYADSLGAFSAEGFRFSDPAHPERVRNYRHGIDLIAALPCDVLMTPHPGQSNFLERMASHDAGARPDPLFDTGACRAYATAGRKALDARLVKERTAQEGKRAQP